jgi:hypothetical protein
MKQYISAILINALLIQLVGCYSQKAITYQEFYNLQNFDEAVIHTTTNKLIKLTTDSLKNSYVKWDTSEDSIIVWSTRTVHEKNYSRAFSDTIKLTSSEIDKVYIDEYDETKTLITIAVSVAIIILVGIIVKKNLKILDGNIFSNNTHL